MPDVSSFNWVKDILAPFGTWLLVIIGWFFVSSDNNKRENRKEVRLAINAISTTLTNLQKLVFRYYTSAINAPGVDDISVEIKDEIMRLGLQLEVLKKHDDKFNLDTEYLKLKQDVTGNANFDSNNRRQLNRNDRDLMTMALSGQSLLEELEVRFVKYYFN